MQTNDPQGFDRRTCLYHYTSAAGLDGILRQRLLRASDTAFLNDWQEIIYAAEPLIDRMSELLESVRQDDATRDPQQMTRSSIVKSALNAIKRFAHLDKDMPTPNPGQYIDGATYVACLSEEHDQLGQWRAYGQRGYAIGFRKVGLEQTSGQLKKVVYGENGINEICKTIIDYFKTRRLVGHPGTHGYFDAMNFCMPLLAAVKHEAFQQEAEWRIIVSNYGGTGPPVKVRTSPRLIPYVELRFDPSCIAEIVIGPGGDFHAKRAVRAALRASNYNPDTVLITQSTAPFRG
ncbi:DUF2971 domain-containing protein [Mycobacterium sp. SM1]|uniref:DUF2971 domain-containing protein n=1 Tax=Mycobacterium sp. SM1 TaxID=2816243 RepID=UPI001BD00236|nr:DUF2971 domain-containing protein [Mycobacterium sp. SM1]MBS4729918.1 DUF2971 domain-containing protein [Mycobacterium sp. SM1]